MASNNEKKIPIKNLKDVLAQASKNATQIVGNAETIKAISNAGLKIDKRIMLNDEEYVKKLFEKRERDAIEKIKKFPNSPQIDIPPIMSLYDEIKECILFGLNGAAISLSAILVEFSLKHAIIDHTKGVDLYNKHEWDRLENKELGPVIIEAKNLGILDEKAAKELKRFKDDVRNLYLHYNIKKITASAVMQQAVKVDIKTGKANVEYNLRAEDHPFLWQMSKKKIDEESVMAVFGFADTLIKRLFKSFR